MLLFTHREEKKWSDVSLSAVFDCFISYSISNAFCHSFAPPPPNLFLPLSFILPTLSLPSLLSLHLPSPLLTPSFCCVLPLISPVFHLVCSHFYQAVPSPSLPLSVSALSSLFLYSSISVSPSPSLLLPLLHQWSLVIQMSNGASGIIIADMNTKRNTAELPHYYQFSVEEND